MSDALCHHCTEEVNSKVVLFFLLFVVANDQLRGSSPEDAALVQQYVHFADQELLPAAATWVFPTLGLMQYNKQVSLLFFCQLIQYIVLCNGNIKLL